MKTTMHHHCKRIAHRRRGSVAILAAFCLIIVMAFLAFSVDWGYITVTSSELQNAADAGALSGARALPEGPEAAIAAAQRWAAKNSAAGQSVATVAAEDVELGLWDDETARFTVLTGNAAKSANAVRLTCRRTADRGNPLPLFFAPIIGTRTADLSASAIARLQISRCGLIIGLQSVSLSGSSDTDSYASAKGPYSKGSSGQNGHVCSNGGIKMSGSSKIHGDAHPGVGQTVKRSGASGVTGDISPLQEPLSYGSTDLGSVASDNQNSEIPNSKNNAQPLDSKGVFELSGNDSVTLPPGKYYFTKFVLGGNSSVRLSGPTEIYVTGTVSLSGSSSLNPTLDPKHLQLFPMGSQCVFSGSSEVQAVVYAPDTRVRVSGSADLYGALIAGQIVLSGSAAVHADDSLDSQPLGGGVQHSKLVQ